MHLSLLSLPSELIGNIAENLGKDDVQALRSTCKAIASKATHAYYAATFVTCKTDLGTKTSLQRLVGMANTPQIASAVRKLTIIVNTYHHKEYDDTLARRTKETYDTSWLGLSMSTRVRCSDEDLAQAAEKREQVFAMMQEQTSIEKEGADEIALLEAMKHFVNLSAISLCAVVNIDKQKRLSPVYNTGPEWSPIRLQRCRGGPLYVQPRNDPLHTAFWSRASRTFELLMSVVSKTNLRLESLDIFNRSYRCALPVDILAATLSNLETHGNIHYALETLKHLSLSISAPYSEDEIRRRHELPYATVKYSPLRLLNTTPRLQRLDLHNCYLPAPEGTSEAVVKALTSSVQLSDLRHLSMRGFSVHVTDLYSLLDRHPDLQTLELCHMILEAGTWPHIFEGLANSMRSLDKLTLFDLRDTTQGILDYEDRKLFAPAVYSGDEVRAGVRTNYSYLYGSIQSHQLRMHNLLVYGAGC